MLPKWQLIALPAVILIFGAFFYLRYFVAGELIETRSLLQTLQQDLRITLEQLEEEKARATLAEREVDVVRRANGLLRQSERQRQDEIAGLQADLAFYRRLGGASGSQAPLAVHYLELQKTRSPRVFQIIFTLTQNLRWATIISGHIELGVDGIENGVARYLTEKQLLADSSESLRFEFKYFQQIERLITLPENFAANRLTIRLRSGSLKKPVEQSMKWQSLFNQDAATSDSDTPDSASDD